MAVTILALRGVGLCLACPGRPRREFGGLTRACLGVKQGGVYCVFHLEPAVALSSFFFAITRYFLMLGVFVGLFGGQRVGHFFWGGSFWRNRAILRPF